MPSGSGWPFRVNRFGEMVIEGSNQDPDAWKEWAVPFRDTLFPEKLQTRTEWKCSQIPGGVAMPSDFSELEEDGFRVVGWIESEGLLNVYLRREVPGKQRLGTGDAPRPTGTIEDATDETGSPALDEWKKCVDAKWPTSGPCEDPTD